VVLTLAALAAGVAVWYGTRHADQGASAAPSAPGRGPVPVVVAEAVARDVPIWLRGLGTVRAWNTVSVRPKVGGELVSLAFEEGQNLEAGALLAQIDPRPFEIARDQAAAKLAQDEARLGGARRTLNASRALVKARAAGQLEFDLAAATVAEFEAVVRGDRAMLANAKLQLEYTRIVAPISGRAGLRQVDAGNVVVADDPRGLVVLTQLEPIALVFTVPQAELQAVRAALAGGKTPVVEALEVGRGREERVLATGVLSLVDSEVDATTGTLALKAKFDNPDRVLWPGQLLTARVHLEDRAGAIVVPEQAVQSGAEGPFVYVVAEDGTAVLRPVEPDLTQGGLTIVRGLAAGERVVVEGHAKLTPGAAVVEAQAAP
jgi:multidrug efflux system membrane fusion protein